VSRDFLHQIFLSSSPKPLKITLASFQIFSKFCGDIHKSRCTTGINNTGANCCQYQQHWWKICRRCQPYPQQICHGVNNASVKLPPVANNGMLSDCWQLKVNLKEKLYLFANSTTQRCPKEIMKTFLIEDFFHLPLVSTIQVVHLELLISLQISKRL